MENDSLTETKQPAIIFHSFTGDRILKLLNTDFINEEDFICQTHENDDELQETNKETYFRNFDAIMHHIESNEVQKVVLSRVKKHKTNQNPLDIFMRLNERYKNTCNYIFSTPVSGTWIGASPELLLSISRNLVETVSLAGTKPLSDHLLWTEKEFHEQQIVTDFIEEKLRLCGLNEIRISARTTVQAGTVAHLKTSLTGVLSEPQQVFRLLKELHPTPATCGLPKEDAKILIEKTEQHKRQFYTGFYGITNSDQSVFFVNLRCMKIIGSAALLFVGGGITLLSNAEDEWNETERKAETLARVL